MTTRFSCIAAACLRFTSKFILGMCCIASAFAENAFTYGYAPSRLGSSDRYGYALWRTSLTDIILNGESVPLNIHFTSDPRPAPTPSPLGGGWMMPFFSSALVELGQSSLRWHRPDGRIFYFSVEKGNTSAKSSSVNTATYSSMSGSWRGVKGSKKRQYILTHKESGTELIYEEGLLVLLSFSEAGSFERYSISYNRYRCPVRMAVAGTGKILAEFIYPNGNRAKELRIGNLVDEEYKIISFDYADAGLTQFSAAPYLSAISADTLKLYDFNYKSDNHNINEMRIGGQLVEGNITTVSWDAHTGFLRADGSYTYQIENPSLANRGRPSPEYGKKKPDANVVADGKASVVDYNWKPDEARITRKDNSGKEEYRFYDRTKGLLTKKNADGSSVLTYFLLTPGPTAGKVRKVEEVKDGKTVVLERHAYDEFGRITRTIAKDGSISIWEYSQGGNFVRKITDGNVVEEILSKDGEIANHKIYGAGKVTERMMDHTETGRIISFSENDNLVWRDRYRKDETIEARESFPGRNITLFDDRGREAKTFIGGVLQSERIYDPSGKWQRLIVYDSGALVPSRVFLKTFDDAGRLISETLE